MDLLKIGLTGGIASGKSVVSALFKRHKVPIIDADKIARDLFAPNAPLLEKLKQKFGNAIFYETGELDRKSLGKIVFNSSADLKWLNQLTHPQVAKEITRQLNSLKCPYVILDIPLLIDMSGKIPQHLKPFIDRVLVIDTSEKNQIARLCHRDNISPEMAVSIMANQSSREQKLNLADDIIDNNGQIEQLESQVTLLHNQYLKLSHARSTSD